MVLYSNIIIVSSKAGVAVIIESDSQVKIPSVVKNFEQECIMSNAFLVPVAVAQKTVIVINEFLPSNPDTQVVGYLPLCLCLIW